MFVCLKYILDLHFVCSFAADVQRLDLKDCNLYGVSPSDPGPMVLCNQCNHIMAPEGIMRHVKRVHGSKIVPAPSNKLRIPTKGSSTAGSILSNTTTQNVNRLTNSSSVTAQATDTTLSTEFSNRLSVSKMAPPTPINAATGKIKHCFYILHQFTAQVVGTRTTMAEKEQMKSSERIHLFGIHRIRARILSTNRLFFFFPNFIFVLHALTF